MTHNNVDDSFAESNTITVDGATVCTHNIRHTSTRESLVTTPPTIGIFSNTYLGDILLKRSGATRTYDVSGRTVIELCDDEFGTTITHGNYHNVLMSRM